MTIAILLALLFAIGLRVRWNNVRGYSPADEKSMLGHARAVLSPGFSYRAYCERWLSSASNFCTPGPVRYGNLLLLAAAFRVTKRWKHRTMAWVSTVAGVLHVVAVAGIALELAGRREAAFAACLAATSCLGLAMSRRALQDAAISATALGATWALLAGHPILGAVLLSFLAAQKETALLLYPAIAATCWAAGRPTLAPFVAGVALYVAGFVALTRSPMLLWRFARAVSSVGAHPYSVRHQSGPLHRLPLDLFALGPGAVLLATRSPLGPELGGAMLILLTLGVVPATKNVRLALPADGLLRVAAGATLAAMPDLVGAGCALVAMVAELWIFRRVFLQAGVYDPVTTNVLVALGMVPADLHGGLGASTPNPIRNAA